MCNDRLISSSSSSKATASGATPYGSSSMQYHHQRKCDRASQMDVLVSLIPKPAYTLTRLQSNVTFVSTFQHFQGNYITSCKATINNIFKCEQMRSKMSPTRHFIAGGWVVMNSISIFNSPLPNTNFGTTLSFESADKEHWNA